jgi:very-long-chain enoyl-CoA reductase
MPTLAVVTPVKIVAAGRAPPLARGLPVTLDVPGAWDELAVGAVKAALAERFPQVRPPHAPARWSDRAQFYAARQKISRVGDRAALADDVLLKETGMQEDGAELAVKDLGPQISWRTVFLVEYVRALLPP